MAAAQAAPPSPPDPSTPAPTRSSEFEAALALSANNSGSGTWMEVAPSAGYSFGRWSVELGVPIYYLNAGSTPGGSSLGGPGDVYASVSLDLSSPRLEVYTTGTLSAATGSVSRGLGAGQTSWDWTTDAAVAAGRVGPYVSVGLANNLRTAGQTAGGGSTGRSSAISNGKVAHLDAGVEVDVWRQSSVSVSGYLVSAFGLQSVVASPVPRLRPVPVRSGPGAGPGGPGGARPPGRPGVAGPNQAFEVTAEDEISDRGVTLTLATQVGASTLSLWVSQSLWYDYTAVSLSAVIDLTALRRRPPTPPGSAPSRR